MNTPKKAPDFSKIHQRNFDRMESLDETVNREKERAKLLLSATKAVPGKNSN